MSKFIFRDRLDHVKAVLRSEKCVDHVPDFARLFCREFDVVSVGARPTGHLHIGNLLVIAAAIRYLKENPNARFVFDIMDLDFDSQRGRVFTPFTRLLQTRNFLEQVELAIVFITSALSVSTGRVAVTSLSQKLDAVLPEKMQSAPTQTFRDRLIDLFTDRETTRAMKYAAINSCSGQPRKPPISLICPDCQQSSSTFAVYRESTGKFSSTCFNSSCGTNVYPSDLRCGPFNIYYTVAPIRDLFEEGRVVHLFGGDYLQETGQVKFPKFARVAAGMEVARMAWELDAGIPSFFLTPLIIGCDGQKVSKSRSSSDGNPFSAIQSKVQKALEILNSAISCPTHQVFEIDPNDCTG